MVNDLLNRLRERDDFHKRCDYLLDHSEITHLLSYIIYLQKKLGLVSIKCNKCGYIVTGDGRGTYISCKCGAIAIDQTEHYTRIIGEEEDYKVVS